MAIRYAILGLLSWKPLSGYDLKRMFIEITALYWSGNNNQIYRTLVQFLEEGLVSHEVQHQDRSPTKKIYSVTEKGLRSLHKWILSTPESPEFRNTFLIQLAWADRLDSRELDSLIGRYKQEAGLPQLSLPA